MVLAWAELASMMLGCCGWLAGHRYAVAKVSVEFCNIEKLLICHHWHHDENVLSLKPFTSNYVYVKGSRWKKIRAKGQGLSVKSPLALVKRLILYNEIFTYFYIKYLYAACWKIFNQTTATFKLLSVKKDVFRSRWCSYMTHQQEANWA